MHKYNKKIKPKNERPKHRISSSPVKNNNRVMLWKTWLSQVSQRLEEMVKLLRQ